MYRQKSGKGSKLNKNSNVLLNCFQDDVRQLKIIAGPKYTDSFLEYARGRLIKHDNEPDAQKTDRITFMRSIFLRFVNKERQREKRARLREQKQIAKDLKKEAYRIKKAASASAFEEESDEEAQTRCIGTKLFLCAY